MMRPIETTEAERLRRLELRVNDAAYSTIIRAILLRQAMEGETGAVDSELSGRAVAHIASEWMTTQAELLREGRA